MRFDVRFDRKAKTWEVIDTLSAGQTIGAHHQKMAAIVQAESEERRWRRFGPGAETFALMADPSRPI